MLLLCCSKLCTFHTICVCVFFLLWSRNWKAKLGLQLRKWKLHLYTMHSSCPKFRVLPRSKDPLDSLYECVCGNTLPLTRAPGFESSTSFTAPPTLCCCLSERKSLRCKLQSFEQLFHLHRLCKLQQQKLLKVYRIIGAMAIFKPSLSNYSCNMGKQRGKLSDKRAYATSVFHLSMLWIKSLRRA